jgi:hypothetical protein
VHALVQFYEVEAATLNIFWGYVINALSTKWEEPEMFQATTSCISAFLIRFREQFGADKL